MNEILLAIPVIIAGTYFQGKIYEHKRNCLKTTVGRTGKNEIDTEILGTYYSG